MSDSLSTIDPVLGRWAASHGLELLSFDESRCVYLGSRYECCQIWLAGPLAETIAVHASEVESLKDEELVFKVARPPSMKNP